MNGLLLALNLALLAGAVALLFAGSRIRRPRLVPAAALLAFVLDTACMTGLTLRLAPGWMVATSYGASLASLAAAVIVIGRRPSDGGEGDEDDWRSGGDDRSDPPGGGGEPAWWPEFERDFNAYSRSRSFDPR